MGTVCGVGAVTACLTVDTVLVPSKLQPGKEATGWGEANLARGAGHTGDGVCSGAPCTWGSRLRWYLHTPRARLHRGGLILVSLKPQEAESPTQMI